MGAATNKRHKPMKIKEESKQEITQEDASVLDSYPNMNSA